MNVLVVDDSSVMRKIHQRSMETLGWKVWTAEHGKDALEKIGGIDGVDLLLTDLHMPEMDGLELIVSVRKDPRFAALKILMVTSDGVMEAIQKAMTAGASDVLIKPFSSEVFAEKIKSLTRA